MKRINPIVKKFRSKVVLELDQALVTYFAVTEGTKQIRLNSRRSQDGKIEIKEHPSNSAHRTLYWGLTNKSALKLLNKNPHNVIEIFHGRILQIWFDFLGDVYSCMVSDVLTGKRKWKLPKAYPQVDLAKNDPRKYRAILMESLYNSFCFLPSLEKRKIIFNALSSSNNIAQYIDKIKADADLIERNITIRNLIQHHSGRVRREDLKRHGVTHFEIVISDRKMKMIKANQKIYITYKNLEILAKAMSDVAEAVRKTWIVSAI